ncbi:DUF4332 domain-containing protein [Candidatus Saccharibacteria bacterium]|nr:MAG: DUF4332 domain-containing protein [Candidatus Saccharibacteria bacterium]
MTQITEMKGMTPKRVTAFHAVGIHTAKQLLEVGATPLGRLKLADETCLGLAEIEQYVHQADLCRICDIAPAHAHLLYHAGVTTIPKLAYRRPEALHEALRAQSPRTAPSIDELQQYIAQAKRLQKVIRH